MKNNISGTLLYLFILLLLLVVYTFAIFIPLGNKITQVNLLHQSNQALVSAYMSQQQNRSTIESTVTKLEKKLESTAAAQLLTGDDLNTEISSAASASGISITSIKISSGDSVTLSGHVFKTITAKLSFKSDINRFLSLINYFEKSKSAVYYIDSVSTQDSNNEVSVTMYYTGD